MYCPNCGFNLNDDMLFCPECGEKRYVLEPQVTNNVLVENQSSRGCFPESETIVHVHRKKTALEEQKNIKKHKTFITEFHIMNHDIILSQSQIEYNRVRKQFRKLAIDCADNFKNLYAQNTSLKEAIENVPKQALQALEPALKFSVSYMLSHGVYTIDEDIFYSKYILDNEQWIDAYQKIIDNYAEITLSKEQLDNYRRNRRESRGKWVGGGFGLQGAIKGAATASAMNMVTGAGHAFFNGIGSIASSISTSIKLNRILNSQETINSLTMGIRNTVFFMQTALAKCMFDYAKKQDLLNGSISKEEKETAIAILNNIPRIPSIEKRTQALIEAFSKNPYSEKWYSIVFEYYGDENGDLERLAEYLDISIVAKHKDMALEKLYNSLNINTEHDALHAKELLDELKENICYKGNSTIFEKIEKEILRFDVEARTVDGIIFKNRSEANFNRNEYNSFISFYNSTDFNDLNSLKSLLSKLQNYSGEVAQKHKEDIKGKIDALDLKLRTIVVPDESIPDIIFDTIEAAQRSRGYAKAIFSIFKIQPSKIYERPSFYNESLRVVQSDLRTASHPEAYKAFIEMLDNATKGTNQILLNYHTEAMSYYEKLPEYNKRKLHLTNELKNNPKWISNVKNSYLNKLNFSEKENIVAIYDGTVFGSCDKGFTITDQGIYSSGATFKNGKFFIPKERLFECDISVGPDYLIIDGNYIDIMQTNRPQLRILREFILHLSKATPYTISKYTITLPDNC